MKKYIVFWNAGVCGGEVNSGVIEWDGNPQDLVEDYYPEAEDWFWNFNDEEDFEDYEPEFDIWWEEYNSEIHDGKL